MKNYRRHPKLSAEIDARLRSPPSDHIYRVENAVLAATAASESSKRYLLDNLGVASYPQWHAWALLETWGIDDPEVREVLTTLATGPSSRASEIAHLMPRIFGREDARSRLLQLLRDPEARRVNFIMNGLDALDDTKSDEEIMNAILAELRTRGTPFGDDALGHLIAAYGWHDRVKELAREQARLGNWTIGSIAVAYPNDREFAPHVFRVARTIPTELRQTIVSDESISLSDPALAVELLGNWSQEEDDSVKTEASVRYHDLSRCSLV